MNNLGTAPMPQRLLAKSGATAALALSLGIAAHAQTPVVSYTFDDSSNPATTVSIGSDAASNATLAFYDRFYNTPANLHSPSGLGVSGRTGDLAFDNSASSQQGSNGIGGSAQSSAVIPALSNMSAFTICGWYKTNPYIQLSGSPRLVEDITYPASGGTGFFVLGTNLNQLQFGINAFKAYSMSAYTEVNTWTFFAVTYDSSITSTANRVNFYVGYRPGDVDSTTGAPLSPTVVNVGLSQLLNGDPGSSVSGTNILDIGNSVTAFSKDTSGNNIPNSRPFDGYMDDVAIYNTALTQAQIELIRQANLAPGSSGTVSLQGVSGLNLAQPMVFTFTPTGATAATAGAGVTQQTVTLSASTGSTTGSFSLAGVVPGTYTLGVKGAKWLQQNNTNFDTTAGAINSLGFSLLGGDLTGDNRVTIQDYNLFSAAYGTNPASNPLADLNCDGKVSIQDYNIFSSNYGKRGDTTPTFP